MACTSLRLARLSRPGPLALRLLAAACAVSVATACQPASEQADSGALGPRESVFAPETAVGGDAGPAPAQGGTDEAPAPAQGGTDEPATPAAGSAEPADPGFDPSAGMVVIEPQFIKLAEEGRCGELEAATNAAIESAADESAVAVAHVYRGVARLCLGESELAARDLDLARPNAALLSRTSRAVLERLQAEPDRLPVGEAQLRRQVLEPMGPAPLATVPDRSAPAPAATPAPAVTEGAEPAPTSTDG